MSLIPRKVVISSIRQILVGSICWIWFPSQVGLGLGLKSSARNRPISANLPTGWAMLTLHV